MTKSRTWIKAAWFDDDGQFAGGQIPSAHSWGRSRYSVIRSMELRLVTIYKRGKLELANVRARCQTEENDSAYPSISSAKIIKRLNNSQRRRDGNTRHSRWCSTMDCERSSGEQATSAEKLCSDREPHIQCTGAIPQGKGFVDVEAESSSERGFSTECSDSCYSCRLSGEYSISFERILNSPTRTSWKPAQRLSQTESQVESSTMSAPEKIGEAVVAAIRFKSRLTLR